MAAANEDREALAARIVATADAGETMPPVTGTRADFDLDAALDVAARVARLRAARGERQVGWKIGFTNRTIWDEYGVHAPIWGPMYDTTLAAIPEASLPFAWSLGKLVQPRIEPEIIFRLREAPAPAMDERALLGVIDGVAHEFEIVQSIYPDWIFRAPDTVAAFALHGAYRHGPFTPLDAATRAKWFDGLTRFEITLSRDGVEVDRGQAVNVLDGPLSALRHFVRGLEPIRPDEG